MTCATFLTTGSVSLLLGDGLAEALGPPEVPLSLPSLGTAGNDKKDDLNRSFSICLL